MPSGGDDYFKIDVIKKATRMSEVRGAIKADAMPMSYKSGAAVGKLLRILSFPAEATLWGYAVYVSSHINEWIFPDNLTDGP